MKTMKWWHLFGMLALVSCAGTQRQCAAGCAESYGADWMVAQYGYDGRPVACWRLVNTSVTNEPASDGIYWLDTNTGNLVHISGWYNRVQVIGGNWKHAATSLNVDGDACREGAYTPKAPTKVIEEPAK